MWSAADLPPLLRCSRFSRRSATSAFVAEATIRKPTSRLTTQVRRTRKTNPPLSAKRFTQASVPKLTWFVTLVPVAVQFVVFLRWLHRRMRNEEITSTFVRDIATNHLPHIYTALQKIAAEQGITLDETPMVQFVDLHHRKGRGN